MILWMASLAGGFLPVAAQPYGIANPDARTLGMGGIETVTSADAYAAVGHRDYSRIGL